VACSAIFTLGTALQTFVFVDLALIGAAMRFAGLSEADAAVAAPGFLTGFRLVGVVYILGNAVGLLALSGKTWVFWVTLLVNVTQGAGVFVIPPSVIAAMREVHSGAAYVTTLIVDGGGLTLSAILLTSFIQFRQPWAYTRESAPRKAVAGHPA
jgi:hypothetical protein